MKITTYKIRCKMDATISESDTNEYNMEKNIVYEKKDPIGITSIIEGTPEEIKLFFCKKIDSLVSILNKWLQENEGEHE